MNTYSVDYRVMVPEWDGAIIHAEDRNEAEDLARQEAQDKYPEGSDIEIVKIEEQF